jgi:hypothetical protein
MAAHRFWQAEFAGCADGQNCDIRAPGCKAQSFFRARYHERSVRCVCFSDRRCNADDFRERKLSNQIVSVPIFIVKEFAGL